MIGSKWVVAAHYWKIFVEIVYPHLPPTHTSTLYIQQQLEALTLLPSENYPNLIPVWERLPLIPVTWEFH